MLSWFLVGSELSHFVIHGLVLLQLVSIEGYSDSLRILYFGWDCLSSLGCFVITRQCRHLVILHTVIHLLALVQLTTGYPIFFAAAFEMAELQFETQSALAIFNYVCGTLLDMATHLCHVQALWQLSALSSQKK